MISVIIPTYNSLSTLIEALKSIFIQNVKGIEIIIIDDSPDNKIKHYIASLNNCFIKYYKNKKVLGTTESRIKGLLLASNQYIAFMDHDDISTNNAYKVLLKAMKKNNYDFVFSNYIINNHLTKTVIKKNLSIFKKKFVKNILYGPGPFFQCCLFKKDFLINSLNCFDKKSEPSEDWCFFIGITQNTINFEHINIYSFMWNLNEKSQSNNYKKELLALKYITKKYYSIMLKNSKKNLSLQFRKIGCMFYYLKEYENSVYYFKKAFKINKLSLKNFVLVLTQIMPQKLYFMLMNLYVKKIVS